MSSVLHSHVPETFDPIAFLQEIVAIDSCDPPGSELDVARAVHRELVKAGIEAEFDEFKPGRANVLGRIRGRGDKPAIILSSHMDTVPVGRQAWQRNPFSGEVHDGRLFGRGATDMKSALAAMIAAAVELRAEAGGLAGDVVLAFTAGESSNLLGARRFIERGLQTEIGAFLCGEPSSLDVIIVEKAVLWLRAVATGQIGHVSGNAGINAIDLMVDFLASLRRMPLESAPHPLLDAPTLRIGRIEGGSAVNVTPDSCSTEIDIRLLPSTDHQAILGMVQSLTPSGIDIEVMDFKPAVESRADDPFVTICASTCRRHLNREPAIKGVSYYSDASVLLDGLAVPFAIVGPGELGLSGQPNEFVHVENVRLAAAIYRDVVREWLA